MYLLQNLDLETLFSFWTALLSLSNPVDGIGIYVR